MCNACGFGCCADDRFEGCGCYHCDNPACRLYCPVCLQDEATCGGHPDTYINRSMLLTRSQIERRWADVDDPPDDANGGDGGSALQSTLDGIP